MNQISQKPEESDKAPQQNTSTENANLHKDNSYDLAQIEVKVLFGNNQDGEKSYKTTYQLTQVSGGENEKASVPQVRVTYKNKADKDDYAVEEVAVKKMTNNAYQITAKIIETKPGETVVPKVVWVE